MVASRMGRSGPVAMAEVVANHSVTTSQIVCLLFDGAVLGEQASHGLTTTKPLANNRLTRSTSDVCTIERKSP